MKTAISIPNLIFKEAEKMADSMKLSRSALYTRAVIEFVEMHRRDNITSALNQIYKHESSALDKSLLGAQIKSLPEEDW